MKPAPFTYHRPSSAAEAVTLLADKGDSAKLLAGGQSLIPMMALRLATFEHLIDLGWIDELRGIQTGDSRLKVGAGTTEATIEHDPTVASAVPLLSRATPLIGHFQIRNRGTVGGSIAHADPAAEYPAVAITLDATMECVSSGGRRDVPASEFFTGPFDTVLSDDELLAAVSFPRWTGRCGFSIEEFARRHGDFAVAGALVAVELDEQDRVARCAIGMFGVGSTPERARHVERDVLAEHAASIDPIEIGRQAVSALDSVPTDLHGSADYRIRVAAAMTRRAWSNACAEARGE